MRLLTRRYQTNPDALIAVLCPLLIKLNTINDEIFIAENTKHVRASFTVMLDPENESVLSVGRTGKFVPAGYGADDGAKASWREIAKGRIIEVDVANGIAYGEIYMGFGGSGFKDREILIAALSQLDTNCYLEVDQYGTAAKALSGLTEYYLVQTLKEQGFGVLRMPEDMARHLGRYANYDFLVSRDGVEKKLEVKSLWGTNTKYARLIHSGTKRPSGPESSWKQDQKDNYYPTNSCKFKTQDFFAVSLFLRGNQSISEFAFARSIRKTQEHPHGLPASAKFPDHVGQNPLCSVDQKTWFATLAEAWLLP